MIRWRDLSDNELILALARAYRYDYWKRVCDGTVARLLADRRDRATHDEIDDLLNGTRLREAA